MFLALWIDYIRDLRRLIPYLKVSTKLLISNFLTAMSTMLVLFYLFCDGKTEDNLSQMFNMFDMDGNKVFYDMDMNCNKVLGELGAWHFRGC